MKGEARRGEASDGAMKGEARRGATERCEARRGEASDGAMKGEARRGEARRGASVCEARRKARRVARR